MFVSFLIIFLYLISFSSFSLFFIWHSSSSSFFYSKYFEYFEKIACIFYFLFSPYLEYLSFFLFHFDKYFSSIILNILNIYIYILKKYSKSMTIIFFFLLKLNSAWILSTMFAIISKKYGTDFFYIHTKSNAWNSVKKHWCFRNKMSIIVYVRHQNFKINFFNFIYIEY